MGTPMYAPNTISIDKLVRLIGTPKCPTLIDVRAPDEFDADPRLIPSSRQLTFEKQEVWSEIPGSHPAVVICRKVRAQAKGLRRGSEIKVSLRRCWKEGSKHGGK